jgi:methylated-DNA-[protein]-cysteine S-methyltransferase
MRTTVEACWSAKLRAPFAVLGVRARGGAVTELAYLPTSERAQAPADRTAERAVRELERYLDDAEFRFTVPLAPSGTAFQKRVWDAILAIPRGESRTYAEVARTVASAARPVGQACGANPVALIIPCHRVIGSRGAIGGFMRTAGPPPGAHSAPAGGSAAAKPQAWADYTWSASGVPIDIKRWLLAHEGYRFGLF